MELRIWATRILSGHTLEEKLYSPSNLTDQSPGEPLFWKEPTRPYSLRFQKHFSKNKLPKLEDLNSKENRAICLHRFAGHELLAVEIMAYALLAFPQAPKHFRKGVANTLKEEQDHVRLYLSQMKRLGIALEDYPLHKHFWSYTPYLKKPEEYLSVMSLSFEMANLDYAPMYGSAFYEYGDRESAQLMEQILRDEIAHVSFGWNWLKKLKQPGESEWCAWLRSLPASLPPHRAKGKIFQEDHRKKAGISTEWIVSYKNFVKEVPPSFYKDR